MWYGVNNNLPAWRVLCHGLGIDPLPRTCQESKEVGALGIYSVVFVLTRVIGCKRDIHQYC
jgi:hypothetical protein